LDALPLDDVKTFELFSRGDTVGVFQFESDGMRKWLSRLKPSHFEDLIAMNALYRPGPMEKIPDFIERKYGRQAIDYDLPGMDEYLAETYGITVYQEQVMLLSQKLAGFTGGQADSMRKAIGKKNREEMQKMEVLFKEGGIRSGHPEERLRKVWEDWVSFAEYAFNKSHAAGYALLGYQTAYLKANYPAEFMAGVLSRNLGDIDEISKCMDECKRMGLTVLGPDVNESDMNFTVNGRGDVRFGMGGIKGVGAAAIELLVQERMAHGAYVSIYDFVERVHPSVLNKKTMEGLVYAGAFDSFDSIRRVDYFVGNDKEETFLDQLIRYGGKMQAEQGREMQSLFGPEHAMAVVRPEPQMAADYSEIDLLNKERELVGIYISAHPLDSYTFEIKHFSTHSLTDAAGLLQEAAMTNKAPEQDLCLAGLVTSVKRAVAKKTGKPWAEMTVEDFTGSIKFSLFGKDYETFMGYLTPGLSLFVRCQPQPRFGSTSGEWELKIRKVTLLANVKDELIAQVCLKLPVDIITPAFRRELVAALQEHAGATRLNVKLIDQESQMVVDFFSRSFRVSMNPGLVAFLERNGIEYTF